MSKVPKDLLLQAIVTNQCIDGSACVLSGGELSLRPLLPPFVQAAFEIADELRDANPPWLTVPEFERLSLAARSRLLGSDVDETLRVRCEAFPIIDPDDIVDVLAEVANTILYPIGRTGETNSRQSHGRRRLAYRTGLQIVGCRIGGPLGRDAAGDIETSVGRQSDSVRFVNARLPFSLRMIGCVVESPICLNNCELSTLDLSGSAIRGLDATFLRASGSVRLRRTALLAPTDFSGCNVRGVFDATDAVFTPWMRQPGGQAFSPERGVLNLTEGTFQNDVYLNRARVWGGMRMTDAVMERSMFMNRAAIRSPVAILERIAADLAPEDDPCASSDPEMMALLKLRAQSQELTTKLHAWRGVADDTALNFANAEAVWLSRGSGAQGTAVQILAALTSAPPGMEPLHKLLTENMRARTTAVWADGITVKGRIFARGIKSMGRLRFRYAGIGDGFHLEEAFIRSGVAVGETLDSLEGIARKIVDKDRKRSLEALRRLRFETRTAAERRDYPQDDTFALDIREARFGGSIDLGAYVRPQATNLDASPQIFDDDFGRGQFYGVLAGERVDIRGDLSFSGVRFHLPTRWNPAYALELRHANIGGNLDFRDTRHLRGTNLEDASIGGNLIFFDNPDVEPTPRFGTWPKRETLTRLARNTWRVARPLVALVRALDRLLPWTSQAGLAMDDNIKVDGRAWDLHGDLMLRGANIGGDAYLVFDPIGGPNIKAQLVKIGGRLDIYPAAQEFGSNFFRLNFDQFELSNIQADQDRFRLMISAQRDSPNTWRFLSRRARYIDLQNASSVVFCHPPAAWPNQGGLSLAGFSYDRTADIGPLAPHPFSGEITGGPHKFDLAFYREFAKGFGTLFLSAFLGCISITYAFIFLCRQHLWANTDSIEIFGWLRILGLDGRIFEEFLPAGPGNLFLFTLLLAILLLRRSLAQITPRLGQSVPMAVSYLMRQRPSRNRYRTPGAIYWPLDPYIMASKALKEEGLNMSAHRVEVERLRQRTSMLSLRHHFLPKVFMRVVEWAASYGFNTTRTVSMLGALVILTAMLANIAATKGALAPHPKAGEAPATFVSLAYAADVVVPFLDLKETESWRPAVPAGARLPPWVYYVWPKLLKVAGLLLTSIAAAAIATRAESVFARTEE